MAGHGDAGLLAELPRLDEHGGGIRRVRRHADAAVSRLLADRQGRSAGAGVGDELVRAPGAGKTGIGETVEVELAVIQHPGAADLLEAHAVADHDNDVSDLIAQRRHLHIGDVVGAVRPVILEGGLLFGSRFLRTLALAGREKGGCRKDDCCELSHNP